MTGPSPLLLGIFLDERLEYILADKQEGLLPEVAWHGDPCLRHLCAGFCFLLLDDSHSLFRCSDTPHLAEGVHVEGQVEELAVIACDRAVGIAVEWHKPIHIVPHLLVVRVEDMWAVFVYVDALHTFLVDVTAKVRAFVYNQASLSPTRGFVGKRSSEQAGTNYEIVVHHFLG